MYGGQSTHLPLKVNTAGVIPPIFASSILMFPAQIASLRADAVDAADLRGAAARATGATTSLYVALIIFFCYFYTAVTFNPVDVADNMKKYGGFIPGIRPGKATAEYIDKVLTRITFGGAVYISAVCVLPSLHARRSSRCRSTSAAPACMIVVGVALDTVQQIESHLITRNYEGFTGPRGSAHPRPRRGQRGGRASRHAVKKPGVE